MRTIVFTLWKLALRLLRAPFSLFLALGFRFLVGLRRVIALSLKSNVDRAITRTPDLTNLAIERGKKLRVAIIRFDGVGDIALTFPLVDALQKNQNVIEVAFFIPQRVFGAIKNFISVPIIAVKPFTIHYPRVTRLALHRLFIYSFMGPLFSFVQGRRYSRKMGRFDLVLLPRWDHDLDLNTRYFARGLGGLTYGHDPRLIENQSREGFEYRLLDFVCESPQRDAHELDHLQDFAGRLGIKISKSGYLGANLVEKSPRKSKCFLQVNAALQKREWSISNWKELLRVLLDSYPEWLFEVNVSATETFNEIVLGLDPAEKNRVQKVDSTKAGELFAQLSNTLLYVGSDTGPMHLAEYLEIPTIVISCHPKSGRNDHVNSPHRFGNSKTRGKWLSPDVGLDNCRDGCISEESHCIGQVTPCMVTQAVKEIIEK